MDTFLTRLEAAGIQPHLFEGQRITKPAPIQSWPERLALDYLKRFFESNPPATDYTVHDFMKNSWGPLYTVATLFVFNTLDKLEYNVLSYVPEAVSCDSRAALDAFIKNKGYNENTDLVEQVKANASRQPNPYMVPAYAPGGPDPIFVIMQWPDLIEEINRSLVRCAQFCINELAVEWLIEQDIIYRKFPQVVEFFKLNKDEEELTRFFLTFRSPHICPSCDTRNFWVRAQQFSRYTGVKPEVIMSYAEVNRTSHELIPFIVEGAAIPDSVWAFLRTEKITTLLDCFYTVLNLDDTLPRSYYPNMDEEISIILNLLNAQNEKDRPRHILLYGVPGSGKSSFVKTLCKLSNRRGFSITSNGQDGTSQNQNNMNFGVNVPPSESRLLSVSVCDKRVNPNNSIIIIDEADDLINCQMEAYRGNGYDTRNKTLLNQVMDNTHTPCIWITNNTKYAIDPSCRRRYDYSVQFTDFTIEQRKIIWRNCVEKYNLKDIVSDELIDKVSARYPISPGGITNACLALCDFKSTAETAEADIEKVMKAHCNLMGIPNDDTKRFSPCKEYTLDGLNISGSIPIKTIETICAKYIEKLEDSKVSLRSLSILLKGLPGTGKTEFVKYLGSVLHKTVDVLGAESLLDCYVGMTEKKIASAFRNAEESGNILFIDEIDSLLFPRSKAMHSWETSMVTTLLTSMNTFRGIFIGATNHANMNDSASVRRFVFKLEFGYLTQEGLAIFMGKYFPDLQASSNPDIWTRILKLNDICPGDFSTIRMRADFSATPVDLPWVLDALESELAAKRENKEYGDLSPKSIGY